MGDSLERFVTAQDRVWSDVRAELRQGRKTSHWMWFVFPQEAGLGRSEMSRRYALAGTEEARDYLDHPQLGPRLREVTELVLLHTGMSAEAIFGHVDALKFRSSMSLFHAAAPDEAVFARALAAFFPEDDR